MLIRRNPIGKRRRRRPPLTTGESLSRLRLTSGSCPSGATPSPRISATEAACRPLADARPFTSYANTDIPDALPPHARRTASIHHDVKGGPMPMTTPTAATTVKAKFPRPVRLDGIPAARGSAEQPRMVRLTVNLPSHLVEQMRDAVYWTPGLTLAWLIARAVRTSLAELESTNQGPFPKRAKPLRAGRPRLSGQSMQIRPSASNHAGSTTASRG